MPSGTASAGASAQMKVLLVAAKKNLIEDHVNLLQSVGLQSESGFLKIQRS